jgi:hypothetical protein
LILVDSNVLLDVVTNDRRWAAWSQVRLDAAAVEGGIAINDVVYAELSIGYPTIEALETMIRAAGLTMLATPRSALFLAGRVFRRYRSQGGTRTGVLPDFFIGAHAAVADLRLLTRDASRYRTYFPTVGLIAPK